MTRFFPFVFALVLVASAFAQIRTDAIDHLRSTSFTVEGGKVISPMGGGMTSQAVTAKILVWSDRKYYMPGEEIRLRAFGLASDATDLVVNITEQFYSPDDRLLLSDNYSCDCGGSNAGSIPTLANNNFITLLSKQIPGFRQGRYDFYVNISKFVSGSTMGAPPVPYQTTKVTVFVLGGYAAEQNPIVIDSLQLGYANGYIAFLTGTFPKNVVLTYYVGAPPFNGSFGTGAISTDGHTLVLPASIGQKIEGRVVLMYNDGSFSTTSPQTFVAPLVIVPAPPSVIP